MALVIWMNGSGLACGQNTWSNSPCAGSITDWISAFKDGYGLSERVELRARWLGVTFDTTKETRTGLSASDSNLLNPAFGTRVLLWEQHGWLPQPAVTVTTPFAVNGDHSFFSRFNPQVSLADVSCLSQG